MSVCWSDGWSVHRGSVIILGVPQRVDDPGVALRLGKKAPQKATPYALLRPCHLHPSRIQCWVGSAKLANEGSTLLLSANFDKATVSVSSYRVPKKDAPYVIIKIISHLLSDDKEGEII